MLTFTLEQMERVAAKMAASRLFAAKGENEVLAIMLKGASLRMDPILALSAMHVIEGRVELKADTIVALIRQSGLCCEWTVVETTEKRCAIRAHRTDDAQPLTHAFTIEDAQRAGLAGRGNWLKYPRAMLRARCISELGRMLFPDVVTGVYVEGETTDDGALLPPSNVRVLPSQDADALPPSDTADAAHARQLPPPVTTFADEIAACAADGRQLIALAARVTATDVPAYAAAWEQKFNRYDDGTRRQVVGMLAASLPAEAFAHPSWDWLEAVRERLAIQGETANAADAVPS